MEQVGCTLGKYFKQDPETTIAGYYSRSSDSANDAARFTDSKSYRDLSELIDACDMIFLTVPDGSIRDTWNKIKGYDIREKMICHCSGSMSCDDAFDGIEETGAFGYSAHPLFAVSDKYDAYRELTGVFLYRTGLIIFTSPLKSMQRALRRQARGLRLCRGFLQGWAIRLK